MRSLPALSAGHGRPKDVVIEQCEPVFQGYFRVDRYTLRHALYDGGMSDPLVRDVFERGQVAAVLPVDPQTDSVVLIEQFRPGAYAAGLSPWLLECVAGVIETGEDAAQVARRESVEEAGLSIERLEFIVRYLSSPGATSETVTLFAGEVDASNAGGLHGLAEEGEDIRVLTMPVDEAVARLDAGQIVNAKTCIALQWLARHYERLKTSWT